MTSRSLIAFLLCFPTLVLAGPGIWTSHGPTGGSVHEVLVDPDWPATIYLGAGGDLYKTVDAGLNWTTLNVSPNASYFLYPSLSPHDSDLLLVHATVQLFRSEDAGANWTTPSTGLPSTLSIRSLTFDPHIPGRVWLITEDVLYESLDDGASWTEMTMAGQPDLPIRLFADPHAAGRLFLVGRVGDDTVLARSTDAGATWTTVVPSGLQWSALAAPLGFTATPGRLVLAVAAHIMQISTDGGATFSPLPDLPNPYYYGGAVRTISTHPTDPATWYLTFGNGLLRTTDGGTTYTEAGVGIRPYPTAFSNGVQALRLHPTTPTTLFAGADFTGFFVSTDNGATWQRRNNGLRQAAIRALAVHPEEPLWVYSGYGDATGSPSDGLFRSLNRGLTWSATSATLKANGLRSIFIDPNTAANPFTTHVYAAGYANPLISVDGTAQDGSAGIFKSTDGGATWTSIDNGIPFYTLTAASGLYKVSHFNIARSIVANPDSGSGVAGDGPLQTLYLSGSGRIQYDAATGTPTVLAARIYKSTDAGASWSASDTGLPIPIYDTTLNHAHAVQAVPLLIDPDNPDTLYAGTFTGRGDPVQGVPEPLVSSGVINGVFKSTDGGANWVHSSNGLPRFDAGDPDSAIRDVLALALAPSQPTTLYASLNKDYYDAAVYKSTDGGANWTYASTGISGADIRVLLVDPNDADVAYAGATGTDDNPGGVYRTVDGGATWTSYSIGLPPSAALALSLDTSDAVPRLYAGTRNGVFAIDQVPDEDADGVPTTIEAAAPGGGDGNGDGIPDTVQESVASLPGAGDPGRGGDAYVTIELIPVQGACQRLENTHTLAAEGFPLDPGHEFDFGLFRLDIGNCQQAQLAITYHGASFDHGWRFRIYAPSAPDNPYSYAWRDFPATRSGQTWTITVTDNALGDLRATQDAILFQGGIARSEIIFGNGFEGP